MVIYILQRHFSSLPSPTLFSSLLTPSLPRLHLCRRLAHICFIRTLNTWTCFFFFVLFSLSFCIFLSQTLPLKMARMTMFRNNSLSLMSFYVLARQCDQCLSCAVEQRQFCTMYYVARWRKCKKNRPTEGRIDVWLACNRLEISLLLEISDTLD